MKLRCAELEEEAKKLRGRIGELERDSVGRELKEQLQQLLAENTKLSEVNRQLESQLKREQVRLASVNLKSYLPLHGIVRRYTSNYCH